MHNTLIVFASNHGTVERCARELFRLMDGKVDLCNLNRRESIPDLNVYDSLIVGGSIHYGKVQNVIAGFCKNNQSLLAEKRLGLFVNCLYSGEKAQQQLDKAFPESLARHALVREYFGGELDEEKMNFWERLITRQIVRSEELEVYLDKEKITRFANIMTSNNEEKA
ncbi:flavodoxin domain-containing protein [Dysgonomonadaceae bacterium zrk40]|nr:flavodoxin domain-containing protein [Dysgonomonadaceae bacterium zrk40]